MLRGKPWFAHATALCLVTVLSGCDEPASEQRPLPTPEDVSEAAPQADLPDLLQRTRQAIAAGKAAQATQIARQGLTVDSTHAELNNLLATAQAAQGLHDQAIAAAQRVLRHHPDFALAHLNLGGIYFRLQRLEEAETHLLRAVELEPGQPALHRRLADIYRVTRRPDLAIDAIRRAGELLPEEATFAYLLGLSLEQADRQSDAVAAYMLATELDPSMLEAWERITTTGTTVDSATAISAREQIARLRRFEPQETATFRQIRGAILNSPEDPAMHYRLAAFLLENGLHEEALIKFQQVANMQPDDGRLLNHIGGLLSQAEQLDASLPFYLRAAETMPEDPTALLNAGSVYAMQGQLDAALPLYEKALARAPQSPQIHFYYGLALTNAGRNEEAEGILVTGIELAGDSDMAGQMQKILDSLRNDG